MAARQQVGKYGSGGVRMTPDRRERALATSRATLANRLGVSGKVEMLQ